MSAGKYTATLSTTDAVIKVSCVDIGAVGVQLVDGGSFSGTVTFEGSIDGTNWVSIKGTPPSSVTAVGTATGAGIWQFAVAGLNEFRARLSTASAGSIIVSIETCTSPVTKY